MRKKISIGAAVVITLICCIVTFQTTYIVLHNKFEDRYLSEAVNASYGGGTLSENGQNGSSLSSGGDVNFGSDENEVMEANAAFMNKLAARLGEVDALYRTLYIGDLDDDKLIDGAIAGYVAGTGDDYAAYYNSEAFEDFMSDMEGEVAGIGVNVIYNTDYKAIEVLNVVPDSPALKAGVEPGDLIVYVGTGEEKEAVSVIGYYPAINELRGEVGSHALFTVFRGEDYSEEIEFDIVREVVEEISVMPRVYALDEKVGVIKITGFDANTPVQFVDAVEDLKNQGCDRLVIDLRYNPGGELMSIVTILDYILPEGPIVRIFDADGNEVKSYSSEAGELDMPMSVLVNGSTASAAELFTSAVKDYNKATIVGTTTYGKGCMQSTIPLSFGGACSVTYRMYNPPFSDNYHGVGIFPDVEIELDEALEGKNIYKITDEEDNQLEAAVKALYD